MVVVEIKTNWFEFEHTKNCQFHCCILRYRAYQPKNQSDIGLTRPQARHQFQFLHQTILIIIM